MRKDKIFIVNVDNKIYVLKKNIYDYSTFSPDTNVINDVAYNTIKQQFIKLTHFIGNVFTSSIIVNESYQYLYSNEYHYFRITNLVENNNKQHIVIELLNPEFFINGKKIEITYYHLTIHDNFIQKHVIAKHKVDISNINSYKIIKTILNVLTINYIEVIYTDINNNTVRYVFTPEIIYFNNTYFINHFIGNLNKVFLEKCKGVIAKENLEDTYTHTLLLLDLEFINKTVSESIINQVNQNRTKIFSSSQMLSGRTIMDELFFITKSLNEKINSVVKENYLVSNIHGISYTSTTIVNELVPI